MLAYPEDSTHLPSLNQTSIPLEVDVAFYNAYNLQSASFKI